ncbi:magnesium transporter [Marinomonas mediterranea]|jgi:Mg2+ transporter (mgtE)|uniref:Magnesium transporter MgtE n=1 Tax=Marinomonas mediterranea (strain ATCC 700492 / JCM 21426 / NBRC 103028 / MMB-1) TaxID=717774 RepID=F2K197_MARM1|nr:magnesium transporter [Marinomonas mediterranea]ADZ91028.1 magnesium transporter [Marinomonas mediterranea MMB-1]WCN09065.1 magnesium transporter [Marinomonas mediterranea]WCN13096.1 magnesium transporter [Marinomonas mediterranea]WCN17167.1 magnesium transporter [Marinomonas mediterranea MMB-1]
MTEQTTQEHLQTVNESLESGTTMQIRYLLNGALPAQDVARLLESSPPKERKLLWDLIDDKNEGEVLQYLSEDISAQFMKTMDTERLVAVSEQFEHDDLTNILQHLPETLVKEVLASMTAQNRARVETLLSYSEDSAGGLMNTDTITIRPNITVDIVFRFLRRHQELPDMTDNLLIVSRSDKFLGTLPLTKLLVADTSSTVREIMETETTTITSDMPASEVAQLFEKLDLVSAPVIDPETKKLLGRITIDDVVDVIRDEAEHSMLSMAGLEDDEDTFAPILKTTRRRAVWLGVNLVTAFIASYVIGLFQDTLDQIVALAILMPIVASMGGIAGSQVLTLVIRGIALNQIGATNTGWLLNREIVVGALNGILWATVIAAMTALWFDNLQIAYIIAAAIIINLLFAAITGTMLPVILKKLGVDPALAGSVILTTVTDVVGFLSFLGLATLFLV